MSEKSSKTAYFLKSARLGFRRWAEDDFELAWGLWGDPEISRYVGGPFTREQVRERLDRELSNGKLYAIQYWPIFLLENGDHAGCCGLKPYKPEAKIFEMGFYLRKTYHGKGYAMEAALAVIRHAFNVLGAAGLFAGHNPSNEASRGLLIKLGFEYTHDEFFQPTGLYHKSYMLTREKIFLGEKNL